MKFIIYLLITTLGFSNIPMSLLDQSDDYITEIQKEIMNEATNEEVAKVDTSSPYWDVITITGEREVDYTTIEGKSLVVIELPKDFIGEEKLPIISVGKSSAVIDFGIESIEDNQYLFIQHNLEMPIRIYKDNIDKNTFHIAVAKTKQPYKYKVVLDAGHGGFDPGATSQGLYEKDIVLDVVLKMENKLKNLGIDVSYTRSDDTFIAVSERSRISNSINPNAFVSVHVNSNKHTSPRGVGVYICTTRGDVNAKTKLASSIQKGFEEEFPDWKSWGTLEGDYSVIRRTSAPSALIEFGFISNASDRKLLSSETNRERAATAIVHGINEFLTR